MRTTCAAPLLCLLLSVKAEAAPREVAFDCGELWSVGPTAPARALDTLLVQHPRARRFRVTWNSSASLEHDAELARYDRRQQTLFVESRNDWLLNDDDKVPQRRAEMKRWLISGVTRARLHQLLRFYHNKPNEEDNSLSYFPQLNRFGCRVRVLAHFQRTYFVPQPKP